MINITIKDEQCTETESTGVEEYAALPTFLTSESGEQKVAPTRSGSTLHQRRYDLYERLTEAASVCIRRYAGVTELATDDDEDIVELCKLLEEVFQYGLIQQNMKFVASAAKLFQNMHQIVSNAAAAAVSASGTGTGSFGGARGQLNRPRIFKDNDSCFWDFCRKHLNAGDRERFEKLINVKTKVGRGKAFIRAALNERSLSHHFGLWLSKPEILSLHYNHWSLLCDEWMSANLMVLFKRLDDIFFALYVDIVDFDMYTEYTLTPKPKNRELLIYAPEPNEIASKPPVPVIERPITTMVNKKKQAEGELPAEGEEQAKNKTSIGESLHENSVTVISVDDFRTAVERLLPTGTTCSKDICLPHSIDDYLLERADVASHETKEGSVFSSGEKCDSISSLEDGSCQTTPSLHQFPVNNITEAAEEASPFQDEHPLCRDVQHLQLQQDLMEAHEKCNLLETKVAQLSLENRQLIRRLKQYFNESGIDPNSSFAANFLITIPRCKLLTGAGEGGSGHYAYEIHITMRQNLEHWSLLRRYSDFHKLHQGLLRTHPIVSTVTFPPKKCFGNMQPQFVDERRQQLQIYLLNLVELLPQLEACRTKAELQRVFPFLKAR